MTRDALGLPRAATPLGDTALLLPGFYSPRHDARTAGKVLWVPHFHYEDPTPEALDQTPDRCVIRPAIPNTVDACERFIDAIASAEFVMANAMHAAVVALAYGVPFAFWSGSEIDHPLKWAGLSSGVGFSLPWKWSWAPHAEISNTASSRGRREPCLSSHAAGWWGSGRHRLVWPIPLGPTSSALSRLRRERHPVGPGGEAPAADRTSRA